MQLYPHWNARDNYRYGAKKKKRKRDKSDDPGARAAVEDLLGLLSVHLAELRLLENFTAIFLFINVGLCFSGTD